MSNLVTKHPRVWPLLCVLLWSHVQANPTQCRYGELVRNIEVVYANPGQAVPCEVIYDKSMEGSLQTLWRAYNESGYCEAQAQSLVEKLTSIGWSCETVAAAAAQLPTGLVLENEAPPEAATTEMLGDEVPMPKTPAPEGDQ